MPPTLSGSQSYINESVRSDEKDPLARMYGSFLDGLRL